MGSCGTADRRRHRRGDDAATLLHPGGCILSVRRGGDRRAEKQYRTTAYEGVFPSNIALFQRVRIIVCQTFKDQRLVIPTMSRANRRVSY